MNLINGNFFYRKRNKGKYTKRIEAQHVFLLTNELYSKHTLGKGIGALCELVASISLVPAIKVAEAKSIWLSRISAAQFASHKIIYETFLLLLLKINRKILTPLPLSALPRPHSRTVNIFGRFQCSDGAFYERKWNSNNVFKYFPLLFHSLLIVRTTSQIQCCRCTSTIWIHMWIRDIYFY